MRSWMLGVAIGFALITPMARVMLARAFPPGPSIEQQYQNARSALSAYLRQKADQLSNSNADEIILPDDDSAGEPNAAK